MAAIQSFVEEAFESEFWSVYNNNKQEGLSWLKEFLNEPMDCVLYEYVRNWITEFVDGLTLCENFKMAIICSIDIDSFRDFIFMRLEDEILEIKDTNP